MKIIMYINYNSICNFKIEKYQIFITELKNFGFTFFVILKVEADEYLSNN